MKSHSKKNYIYENDILVYESLIDEFTSNVFKDFDSRFNKLDIISRITRLINGEIVNESEGQAALHPKYRSSSRPEYLLKEQNKAKEFLRRHTKECINNNYKEINIITLGIGGSYEGPKLLLECFDSPNLPTSFELDRINFDFITGSDPIEFEHKLKSLNPENTFFVVSSKSFSTDETIKNLKSAFLWSNDKNKFIAITANPSEAIKYGIKEVIQFDEEIGGRYSIWSPISEFHLCEDDFIKFLEGGNQADIEIQDSKEYLEFIKKLSFCDLYLNNKGVNSRVILSYIWNLRSLPNYFQQLEMESLGKSANIDSEFKKTGQIIFGGYGPTAQHSYFQLLHQGTQNICADIIACSQNKDSLAYAQAITQSKLLSRGAEDLKKEERINGNVPVNLFLLKSLDPYTLGYLIATWEHRTYVTSTMLQINAFDQFGVQAGKHFTRKFH